MPSEYDFWDAADTRLNGLAWLSANGVDVAHVPQDATFEWRHGGTYFVIEMVAAGEGYPPRRYRRAFLVVTPLPSNWPAPPAEVTPDVGSEAAFLAAVGGPLPPLIYPQPREGVVGIQRTDDLLSLEDSATAHRDALITLAYHLRRSANTGGAASVVERMRARMYAPVVGDLVVTTSALYRRGATGAETRLHGLGYLVAHRKEWAETDEEYARVVAEYPDHDGYRASEEAWYIQYGPAPDDICRWTNEDCMAIPIAGWWDQ